MIQLLKWLFGRDTGQLDPGVPPSRPGVPVRFVDRPWRSFEGSPSSADGAFASAASSDTVGDPVCAPGAIGEGASDYAWDGGSSGGGGASDSWSDSSSDSGSSSDSDSGGDSGSD